MPSPRPLAEEAKEGENYYLSADGSLHVAPRRLTIETRHNASRYPLPSGIGNILRVRLYASDVRPFEFLECPSTANYIRVFANGQTPQDEAGARQLLKTIYGKFHTHLWLRWNGNLYIHPHPVNAGELLILDFEPTPPEIAHAEPDERG